MARNTQSSIRNYLPSPAGPSSSRGGAASSPILLDSPPNLTPAKRRRSHEESSHFDDNELDDDSSDGLEAIRLDTKKTKLGMEEDDSDDGRRIALGAGSSGRKESERKKKKKVVVDSDEDDDMAGDEEMSEQRISSQRHPSAPPSDGDEGVIMVNAPPPSSPPINIASPSPPPQPKSSLHESVPPANPPNPAPTRPLPRRRTRNNASSAASAPASANVPGRSPSPEVVWVEVPPVDFDRRHYTLSPSVPPSPSEAAFQVATTGKKASTSSSSKGKESQLETVNERPTRATAAAKGKGKAKEKERTVKEAPKSRAGPSKAASKGKGNPDPLRKQPALVSSEDQSSTKTPDSEDSEDDVPRRKGKTKQGKGRSKATAEPKGKGKQNRKTLASSTEESSDSDEEDSSEEERRRNRAKKAKAKKGKKKRARDPDEESEIDKDALLSEIEMDEPVVVDSRLRGKAKEPQWKIDLAKQQKKRLQAKAGKKGSKRNPRELSSESSDGAYTIETVSSGDEDFVTDGSGQDEFDPATLPSRFRNSQGLDHHFKTLSQYYVWLIVEGDKMTKYATNNMFKPPLEAVRRMMNGNRDSVAASSVWKPAFKRALQTYPEFDVSYLDDAVPYCDACKITGRMSKYEGMLSGKAYDHRTFRDLDATDSSEDSSEDSSDDESEKGPYKLGSFCRKRTEIFHEFCHWERSLYLAYKQPYLSLKSGRMNPGSFDMKNIEDPDEVLEWLDRRGKLAAEQQKIQNLIDRAQNLEAHGGGRFE